MKNIECAKTRELTKTTHISLAVREIYFSKTKSSAFEGERYLLNLFCDCDFFPILKANSKGMGVMTNVFEIQQRRTA